MNWARFDDRFPNHPKVLALSDAAFRLHVSAVCYCCDQLTDGFLADCVPDSLPKAPRGARLRTAIELLERVGLWDRIHDGWNVHDYLDRNPSAAAVAAKRAARAAAGRQGGLAKARGRPSSNCQDGCHDDRRLLLRPRAKQTAAPSPSPYPDLPVAEIQDLAGSARVDAPGSGGGDNGRSKSEARRPGAGPPGASGANVVPARAHPDGDRPTNLEQALATPIGARACWLQADPMLWEYLEPHRWPEVLAVAAAMAKATGTGSIRLGSRRDRGVEAVVALYADGWSQMEIIRAVHTIVRSSWWTERPRGLSSLTPEVLRRAFADEPPPEEDSPRVQAALASIQKSMRETQ